MTTTPPTQSAIATNSFGDTYLYSINRGSFDKSGSIVVFESVFKQQLFVEDTLNIIIGTDSGLLPKYIKQKGIPAGTRYLFIEPEDVLNSLKQQRLLDDQDDKIIYTTAENWQEKANHLKINEYFYINGVRLFSAICAQQLTLDEYAELNWLTQETLQTLHWQYNAAIGSESFIFRQLENVCENILPASLLINAFAGQTAIILAGGPSLTELLPWIKQNRDKFAIFSVSRISRQLVAAGIDPDFVFSVDPQDISRDVSREMLQFGDDTIFINSYHVHPSLLSQWHGRSLYLGKRLPWQSELNEENFDGVGPTVTNTALNTAYHYGFSRILLAGFDLCFTKEGITHAEGSNEQLAGPKYDLTSLQVETYNGEKRPTSHDFYTALTVLSQQAQRISSNNRQIINLSPTAAKTEFIEHIPPEKLILAPLSTCVRDIAARAIPAITDDLLQKHYKAVSNELKRTLHQLKNIKKLAQQALKINDAMYDKNGLIGNYKHKRELDTIEKQLNRRYKIYSKLIKHFGVRNFLKITAPHNEDWTAEKAQTIGRVYYEAYLSGSSILITQIEKALIRVDVRQEELKNPPDFSKLLLQWRNEKSYARAKLWLNRHPGLTLSQDFANQFSELSEAFNDFLTNIPGKPSPLTHTYSQLPTVKARALILLKHKKIDELHDLFKALNGDNKENGKAPYLKLISAFIAELEDNDNAALNIYDELLNMENSPLLEEVLLRIASISINHQNHENALLALECLSQLSPVYLPFYAESARILGQFMKAIDSYNLYLTQFPNDTQCKLKLANLYLENGIPAAAEMMIDHVLEQIPDLPAALILKKMISAQKLND